MVRVLWREEIFVAYFWRIFIMFLRVFFFFIFAKFTLTQVAFK